jgi:hypothetical protein
VGPLHHQRSPGRLIQAGDTLERHVTAVASLVRFFGNSDGYPYVHLAYLPPSLPSSSLTLPVNLSTSALQVDHAKGTSLWKSPPLLYN